MCLDGPDYISSTVSSSLIISKTANTTNISSTDQPLYPSDRGLLNIYY